MIARITGGNAGIVDYLINGQKQGRFFSRDELDHRITLAGNIDITDQIINSIEDRGQERYYHITLSFREDEVDAAVLEKIVEDYKNILMSAYHSDEYNFYAEAHLPKIKQIKNNKTGEMIDRKPHIHIAIPRINLVSGRVLNTVGMVGNNIPVLDAIQEHINYKYNLDTPKEHLRLGKDDSYANVISRIKGDLFREKQGKAKSILIDKIVNKEINTKTEFQTELEKLGEVRVRNKGKENEYFAVKLGDDKKFTNLKNPIFNENFIINKIVNNLRPSKKAVAINLDLWKNKASKENKYINSNSKKIRNEYRELKTIDERLNYLKSLENQYNKKHNIIDSKSSIDLKQTNYNFNTKPIIIKSSYIKSIINKNTSSYNYNYNLNSKNVLNTLVKTHFININKYKIINNKIIIGKKNYTPLEFLREHINLSEYEINIFIGSVSKNIKKNYVKKEYDHAIKEKQKQIKEFRIFNREFTRKSRQLIFSANSNYIQDFKKLIKNFEDGNLHKLKFDQERTILIFRKLQQLENANIYKQMVMDSKIELNLLIQNTGFTQPKGELKMNEEEIEIMGIGLDPSTDIDLMKRLRFNERMAVWYSQNHQELSKNDLGIEKYENGDIGYRSLKEPDKEIMRDNGVFISFNKKTDITPSNIKIMLELAVAKYGNTLQITGNKEFKDKVIEVIINEKLSVIPKQKDLLLKLQARRNETTKVEQAQEQQDKKTATFNKVLTRNEDKTNNDGLNKQDKKIIDEFKKVIDFGKAPYLFDKTNDTSYFIKLVDSNGVESVQFGKGLEDVVNENKLSIGEFIKLSRAGKEPVKIQQKILDKEGNLVEVIEKDVYRNNWNFEKDLTREIEKSPAAQLLNEIEKAEKLPQDIDEKLREGVKGDVEFQVAYVEDNYNLICSTIDKENQTAEFIEQGGQTTVAKLENGELIFIGREINQTNETITHIYEKDKQRENTVITIDDQGQSVTVKLKENENKEIECFVQDTELGKLTITERKPYILKLERSPKMQEYFKEGQLKELAETGVIVNTKNIQTTITHSEKDNTTREEKEIEEELEL